MHERKTHHDSRSAALLPGFPRRARWTLRGLVTLPLLSLTVASGVLLRCSVYHLLRANLVPIAEAELTRQTGHEVRIGSADFSKRGALVLTDIAVSNKATFAAGHGEATLAARRLTVDYNLHSLIFDSGNAAHALGDITLEQPSLLVERFPGRLQLLRLLQAEDQQRQQAVCRAHSRPSRPAAVPGLRCARHGASGPR